MQADIPIDHSVYARASSNWVCDVIHDGAHVTLHIEVDHVPTLKGPFSIFSFMLPQSLSPIYLICMTLSFSTSTAAPRLGFAIVRAAIANSDPPVPRLRPSDWFLLQLLFTADCLGKLTACLPHTVAVMTHKTCPTDWFLFLKNLCGTHNKWPASEVSFSMKGTFRAKAKGTVFDLPFALRKASPRHLSPFVSFYASPESVGSYALCFAVCRACL